jgi:hypothetical protein
LGSAPDIYYSIVVPNGYKLTIGQTTDTNGYDSIRPLFYGTCDSQNEIVCIDTEITSDTWENTTGTNQTVYYVQDGWAEIAGTYTFTWSLTPPPACNVPRNLDAMLTSATLANFSWSAPVTGTALNYEYAVTTSEVAPQGNTTATTATQITGVAVTVNQINYLHVRANCGTADGYSEWSTFSFYSGVCIPAPLSTDGSDITNVTLGSINNTTEGETGNYGNFSTQSVSMGQGVSYPLSITLLSDNGYNVKVWVDWNDNLTFDTNEEVFTATTAGRTTTVMGTLTVPAGTVIGNHRMRLGVVAT